MPPPPREYAGIFKRACTVRTEIPHSAQQPSKDGPWAVVEIEVNLGQCLCGYPQSRTVLDLIFFDFNRQAHVVWLFYCKNASSKREKLPLAVSIDARIPIGIG